MRPCTQCGKCCLEYQGDSWLGSATELDRAAWEIFSPEVLDYLHPVTHDMWLSPVTGKSLKRCPWLRKFPGQEKYNCRIHKGRPDVCSDFPIDVEQMVALDCEMLEEGDLDKPRLKLVLELDRMRNIS